MIEELFKSKQITRFEYLVYALFECNELGREFFDKMLIDTFMAEPDTMDDGGIKLAILDGRRALFRDIKRALFNIHKKIQELGNDGSSQPEQ